MSPNGRGCAIVTPGLRKSDTNGIFMRRKTLGDAGFLTATLRIFLLIRQIGFRPHATMRMTATRQCDSLSRHARRTVPGVVDVLGNASAGDSVRVNDLPPYRHRGYFQKALAINKSSAPQHQGVTVIATLGAGSTATAGSVFVAKMPEVFSCELHGNLRAAFQSYGKGRIP